MNCSGRRIFGERLNLSPQKLSKAIKAAGSQNVKEIFKNKDAKIKAATIPIPPPFGTNPLWELRSFGLSIRPRPLPQREMSQAPAPPKIMQTKYKTKLSTDYTDYIQTY
jgi:hypothetical protein